jgi:hypothetical protein
MRWDLGPPFSLTFRKNDYMRVSMEAAFMAGGPLSTDGQHTNLVVLGCEEWPCPFTGKTLYRYRVRPVIAPAPAPAE